MKLERIGPYRIERELGSGGMGVVYYAVHDESHEPVAVKVLSAQMANQGGFVERFNREIAALKKLSNPHIVRLYESGVDDGMYYYAMEYVEGQTLTELLKEKQRLPWRHVITIAVQVCTALKAAHDAGIIHRDLKPGNLLITDAGEVKLADFGVAQLFAESKLTVTGGVVGTAEYMSPEQARGVRVTRKSDLYSLGAVIYVMLTGRPPFQGNSTVDVLHKHQFAQLERPARLVADLPSWLDDFVCTLLDKDPEKRPPDARVAGRRLQEIVKKVELSQQSETRAVNQPEVSGRDHAVGPTLMRDLVKAEVERVHTSAVGGLLDNIWVLLTLLVLIVLGGVWWFGGRTPSQQDLFDRGVELMQQSEGPDWLEARDEYFQPLLAADAEQWSEQVEPYLQQVELYELRREIEGPRIRRQSAGQEPDDEVQRLLRMAVAYREMGDAVRAQEVLDALLVLVDGVPEYTSHAALANELARQLRDSRHQATRQFIEDQLQRLNKLDAEGNATEAARLRSALERLYRDEPAHKWLPPVASGS